MLGLAAEVDVLARWTAHPNRATDAPYTIEHAAGRTTVTVNQRQNGAQYVSLGTYTLTPASTITLTDEADGYVIADAIRLIGTATPVQNPTPAGDGIYFVHTDHLGTPQRLTDIHQTVVWDAVYEPFGRTTHPTEHITFNLRFPGQYFDEETGLHYNYFRDYDPSIGRYTQSDPIGLGGGLNTYLYARANLLRWIDPLGLRVVGSWIQAPRVANANASLIEIHMLDLPVRPLPPGISLALVTLGVSGTVQGVAYCKDVDDCTGEVPPLPT